MSLLPSGVAVMPAVVEDDYGTSLEFYRRDAPLAVLLSFSCRRLFRLVNRSSSSSENTGTIATSLLWLIDEGAFAFRDGSPCSSGRVAWRGGGCAVVDAREPESRVVTLRAADLEDGRTGSAGRLGGASKSSPSSVSSSSSAVVSAFCPSPVARAAGGRLVNACPPAWVDLADTFVLGPSDVILESLVEGP